MAASFPNLYSYLTETGIVVPTTDEIKSAVQNMMYDIFGTDLDVTDETPVGRLIEAFTMLMRTTIGVNAQNANQINPTTSIGVFIDGIAAMFKLARLPATKTTVTATFYGNIPEGYVNVTIPKGTLVGTVSGNTFSVSDDIVVTSEYEDRSFSVNVVVESVEYGVVPCAVGDLIQLLEPIEGVAGVVNTSPATYGRLLETDASLKARIEQARGFQSSSTQAIANAIWNAVPTLSGVVVLENGHSYQVSKSGVDMKPHSIFVCVGGVSDDMDRKLIAKAIFETKTAGADYTDSSTNTDLNPSAIKNQISIGHNDYPIIPNDTEYTVTFYEASLVSLDVSVTINRSKYTGTDLYGDVDAALSQFLSGKGIGSTVTKIEVATAITSAIPSLVVSSVALSVNGESYEQLPVPAFSMLSLGSLTIIQTNR